MSYLFLWVALLIAIINWLAVDRNWRKLEYITKPTVIVALLAWLGMNYGFTGQLIWFAIGLLFSLAGDIFLMLPNRKFIAGLIAFLLALLAYIIGFNPTLPPVNIASLVLAVLVGITAAQVNNRLTIGIVQKGQENLIIPVLIYTITLSLMLLSGLLTLVRPDWEALPAITVSIGAMLFFISDTLLGWIDFVNPLPHGKSFVMITYHLGQISIIFGAALHSLS